MLTCLLAAVIAGGRLIGRNPLGAIMGSQIRMHDAGWRAISWVWVAMFLTTALANEIAWRSLSTDDWVTFKVFGITGISLIFTVISVPIMTRHQIEDSALNSRLLSRFTRFVAKNQIRSRLPHSPDFACRNGDQGNHVARGRCAGGT